MKHLVLAAALLLATATFAQDKTVQELRNETSREIKRDAADTLPRTWRRGGLVGVNISQSSLTNWAAGGDDFALSINALASVYAFYKKDRHAWDNTLDFNYGFVRTTSLGNRKNDDRFDLFSKYGYAVAPQWNLAALGNVRTQFFKGYTYQDDTRLLSSNLLAPAYILLGLGVDYKPAQAFSVYVSPVTARWTIVNDDSLSAKGAYGVAPGNTTKAEFGAFLSANYLKTFNPVLSYKSRLDLFSNYRNQPQNIDLYMTNILSINFTKVLAATWNVDLIYDNDVKIFGPNNTSPGLQIKSLVGVGLLVKMGASR